MILAAVTALIIGVSIGYLLGLRHQASDEVFPDAERQCDEDILHSVRWESRQIPYDMDFIRSARMIDPKEETIHNVPLSDVLVPTGQSGRRVQRHAERATISAIKIDRTTGRVRSAIMPNTRQARSIAPLLRKAGIRTIIDPKVPL